MMHFNCAVEKKDVMSVDKLGTKVRIQLNSEESIFFLKQKDLCELIKYLQTMEEK